MSSDLQIPNFSMAVRGYDRHQVDDYVVRLSRELDDTYTRALAAEQRVATGTDRGGFDDLGRHVADVLQNASQEAERLRSEAQRVAEQVQAEAQREAGQVRARIAQEDEAAGAQRDALLAEAHQQADDMLARVQAYADQRAEDTLNGLEEEAAALRAEVERLRVEQRQAADQVFALADRLTVAVAGGRSQPATRTGGGKRPSPVPAGLSTNAQTDDEAER